MATHRWLTLAAAILITALECWLFTDASAVTFLASSNSVLSGNGDARISSAHLASERARLKPRP